ncbi:hypothetical protein, partial [Microbulbifer sp. 2205BS26-8]|uniref:hypothetical protein n=1 Tax=Microbulbifer sp. 2205BS26-8 TaxID=3064386 RepID=UPI00273E162B
MYKFIGLVFFVSCCFSFAQINKDDAGFEKKLSLYLSENKIAIRELTTKMQAYAKGEPVYTDKFFCSINPNSQNEDKYLFIQNSLLIMVGGEAFPCERGIEAYSKYFDLGNDALYWVSLAARDKLFFETFEKYNGTCSLKKHYPDSIPFL